MARARSRADGVLHRARALADEKLAHAGDSEQLRTLRKERAQEDAVLNAERSVADAELLDERRDRRRALAELLTNERAQTDARLLTERDVADQAVSSRDDFLGIVSHELRNLIGSASMSATTLLTLECADERDCAAIKPHAERIQRQMVRMSRVVSDLLDVASMHAGRLGMHPRRREVDDLVRETQDAFEPLAAAKGISIRVEVKARSLLAQYDPDRILQVLANLVGNALKFTPAGGRVDIVAEPIATEIRFAVADTGPGIAPDQLEIIFDRFWQHSKGRGGWGLGLYISRSIVEAHGGRIWAESRIGEGSTFYFTLPGEQVG